MIFDLVSPRRWRFPWNYAYSPFKVKDYFVVVENFGAYYMEQKKREVIAKKKFDNAEARIEDEASREVKIYLFLKIMSFFIM